MNIQSSEKVDKIHIALFKSKLISNHELNYIYDVIKKINSNTNNSIELFVLEENKYENIKNNINLLICFSDSDVLNSVRIFPICPPILCVELPGDNSFFSQVTLNQFVWGLNEYLSNEFTKDVRTIIQLEFNKTNFYCLNDVHITSSAINRRIRYDINVNNNSLFTEGDSANALLISTPTGSTAMSLNLGGAIIHPQAPVFQIIAIASRNITSKHQIVSSDSELSVEIEEAIFPLVVNVDNYQVETNSNKFIIRKADKIFSFIKFNENLHISHPQDKIQAKLSFEDTQSLTSTAKFVLHVLQKEKKPLSINKIIDITHVRNLKTLSSALHLLMEKGFIKRRENLDDLREYLYYFSYSE